MEMQRFIPAAFLGALLVALVLAIVYRRYPGARSWIHVAAASIAAMPLAVILHNVLSALIRGEEAVSFILALVVAPAAFAVGTLGAGLAIARSGRGWEVGASLLIAGAGMALFGLYGIFALVVTTVEGGNPPYQAAIESLLLPISLLTLLGGAVSALFCAIVPHRQTLA